MFVLNFVINGKVTSSPKVSNMWKEVNILSKISAQNTFLKNSLANEFCTVLTNSKLAWFSYFVLNIQ